jgi:hypothetical protein
VEEIITKYLAVGKWRERVSHVVDRQGIEVFKWKMILPAPVLRGLFLLYFIFC